MRDERWNPTVNDGAAQVLNGIFMRWKGKNEKLNGKGKCALYAILNGKWAILPHFPKNNAIVLALFFRVKSLKTPVFSPEQTRQTRQTLDFTLLQKMGKILRSTLIHLY